MILLFIKPALAGSAEWILFPDKEDVSAEKIWTIKFNMPIDKSTVNASSIYILNEDMKNHEVNLTQSGNGQNIIVTPINNYEPGHPYYLYIINHIKSIYGTNMENNVFMLFTADSDAIKVNSTFNNQTITIKKGDTLQITLLSPIFTGHIWRFAQPLDESILKERDYISINPQPLGIIGGPVWTRWMIQAVGTGETSISFEYLQNWEDNPPDDTFRLNVKVE